MASVSLRSVTKAFGEHAVVRNFTLDVADGELMVLVGPSGCGKSTVLRLVAGLEKPADGRVVIDGVDVTEWSPQARDLAMVFQSYALYPHLTVRQNLSFGLQMRRTPSAMIATRVADVARLLDIESLLDRKPAQLSGGQRQRVALGRAIVREPRAFLLDEPLSNLDPALRVETRTQLARLHRRLQATMLYVTHDQEEAMTLGTQIAVLKAGELQQAGTPLDVYARPANTFVARFVGSPAMNLIDTPLTRALHARGSTTSEDPGSTVIGVRPHDIALVSPEDADRDLRGVVETVEHLGNVQLVHVSVDEGGQSTGEPVRVVVPGDAVVTRSGMVGLKLRLDRLHRFDKRTGNRVEERDAR